MSEAKQKTPRELIEEHTTGGLEAQLDKDYPDLNETERENYLDDWRSEALDEFRCSGERTELDAPIDRYHECEINAAKIGDQWVAWPYWYGGGKHAQPDQIPWLDDAFYVTVREETRVVHVFERVEG